MRRLVLPLVIVAAVALLGAFLYPERLRGPGGESAQLALLQMALLAVLIGGGAFAGRASDPAHTRGKAVIYGVVWVGAFFFLIGAYAQRDAFAQLAASITGAVRPGVAVATDDGGLVLTKAADGHFWIEARIDGQRIRALVDTGATTTSLDPADARRLGIDTDSLRHDIPINTASGRDMAAAIRLRRVALGPVVSEDVEALVLRTGGGVSLLGMNILSSFSEVTVRGDQMRLVP